LENANMPISFTCPHCGLTINVDDQYAGQSVSCVRCKKAVTMPGTPPSGGGEPPEPRAKHRFTVVELLVVITVIGILTALWQPVRSTSREDGRRDVCANNLKQIGLAIHLYNDKYGSFPPAYIADENGKPKHSWRVLILPFMDYGNLYAEYNFDEPWNSPHNMALAAKMPIEYHCPKDPTPAASGITSYAMLVGPHAFSDGPTARHIADITDGLDKTIMVVEVVGAGINWLEPRDLEVDKMTFRIKHPGNEPATDVTDISSGHPHVANVLFCDGSVQSLPDDIDPKLLEALTTIDGGETVNLDDH
jgi:prepilin-type processing-associated H-X9-DG protein